MDNKSWRIVNDEENSSYFDNTAKKLPVQPRSATDARRKKRVTFTLDLEMVKYLRGEARNEGISYSSWVNRLIAVRAGKINEVNTPRRMRVTDRISKRGREVVYRRLREEWPEFKAANKWAKRRDLVWKLVQEWEHSVATMNTAKLVWREED